MEILNLLWQLWYARSIADKAEFTFRMVPKVVVKEAAFIPPWCGGNLGYKRRERSESSAEWVFSISGEDGNVEAKEIKCEALEPLWTESLTVPLFSTKSQSDLLSGRVELKDAIDEVEILKGEEERDCRVHLGSSSESIDGLDSFDSHSRSAIFRESGLCWEKKYSCKISAWPSLRNWMGCWMVGWRVWARELVEKRITDGRKASAMEEFDGE